MAHNDARPDFRFLDPNLQALDRLVKFGFYGTTAEIKDLVDPMISTLDGRADLLTLKQLRASFLAVAYRPATHKEPTAMPSGLMMISLSARKWLWRPDVNWKRRW